MAADLGDLIARILLDSKEFQAAMKGVEDQAQDTADKANKNLSGLSDGLDSIASAAAGLAAALGFAHFIDEVADYAKELKSLSVSFTNLTGSATEAKDILSELGEIAKSSPFEFKTVAEAAKNMLLLGVSADTTTHAMQGIVDAVAALKLGPAAIGSISEALALMQSRGEVSSKAMQTLARSGIDAWQMLADSIGTSVPAAMELVKSHAISVGDVIKGITDGMETNFAGAAARASATWAGTWKNISEGALEAGAAIMQSVTDVMNKLAPLLTPLVAQMGKLADLWKEMPTPVKDAAASIGIAVGAVSSLIGVIAAGSIAWTGLTAAVTAAAGAVGLTVAPFLAVAAAVAGVIAALVLLGSWISAHWNGITTAVTEVWDGLKEIWGGIWSEIVAALTAIWGVLSGVARTAFEAVTGFLATVWDGVKTLWQGAWDIITGALKFAWAAIKAELAIFDTILSYLVPFWEPVKKAFQEAWNTIGGWLTDAWGKLRDSAAVLWGAVGKVMDDATDKQVAAAKKQKDAIVQLTGDYDKAAGQLGIKTTAQLTAAYESAQNALAAMKKASDDAVKAGGERIASDKDILAAQLKVNEAYKNMVEGDKVLQEAEKKTAEEAKKAAAEKEKDAAAADARAKKMEAADQRLEDSVLKLGTTQTKAWQQIQAQADKTVDIVVADWDRWGKASPAGSFALAQAALKALGVESTAMYTKAISDAEAYARDVGIAFAKGTASEADYNAALAVVAQRQKDLKEYTEKDLTGAFKTLGIESSAALQKTADDALDAYNKISSSGDATTTDLTNAWNRVKAAQQAVADNANKDLTDAYHSLGVKTSTEMQTMATNAEAAYQKIAASAGENSLAAQEAWVNKTKIAYDAIVQSGVDLTEAQKTELAKREIAIDEHLEKQKSSYKTAYDAIHDSVKTAFDDLIKTVVTGDGSFGDVMTKMWQSIAEAALHKFLDPVRDAIASFIAHELADLLGGKGFGGVLDSLKKVGAAIADVFTGAGSGAAQAAGGATSAAGGAASGAASAASTAVSASLTSMISAISGVVSAVTGVIGVFQSMHQETSLNAIEHNTRYTMMYVGERADGGILGVLFKIDEEIAWGAQTKATEALKDAFIDWSALVTPMFKAIQNQLEGLAPFIVDSKTALEDIRSLAADLPKVINQGFQSLNVTVTATGVTTAEAAKALGDQIAANLSRQLVPTS